MVQSPSDFVVAGKLCQSVTTVTTGTALKALGDIEVVREVEMVLQEQQDLTMLGRAHGKPKKNETFQDPKMVPKI